MGNSTVRPHCLVNAVLVFIFLLKSLNCYVTTDKLGDNEEEKINFPFLDVIGLCSSMSPSGVMLMVLHAKNLRFQDRRRVIISTADGSRGLDTIVFQGWRGRGPSLKNYLRNININKHVWVRFLSNRCSRQKLNLYDFFCCCFQVDTCPYQNLGINKLRRLAKTMRCVYPAQPTNRESCARPHLL